MSAEDFGDIGFVANACASDVYRWYSGRPRERDYILWQIKCSPAQHIIDYLAFRRHDPLIDLALARFGYSPTVLQRVYRRAPLSTRVALCRNPELLAGPSGQHYSSLGPTSRDFAIQLLENGTDDEVRAFCACPDHQDWVYTLFLESVEGFPLKRGAVRARTNDARFELVLRALSTNKRMQTARTDDPRSQYRDGFSDWEYTKPFDVAWQLADQLPASRRWAEFLHPLYFKLPGSRLKSEEIVPLLEKWASPKTPDDDDGPMREYDPFREVRAHLIERHLRPERSWLDHPDPAYRQAFLACYDPNGSGMRDFDPLDVDLPADAIFHQLEKNEELWRSPRGRDHIWSAARSADWVELRWASESYALMETKHRAKHPDWFEPMDDIIEPSGEDHDPPAAMWQASWMMKALEGLKRTQNRMQILLLAIITAGIVSWLFR